VCITNCTHLKINIRLFVFNGAITALGNEESELRLLPLKELR
jgi:hypothetical protein